MPRTYSFEHFTVPKTSTQSRSLRRRDKQHLSEKRVSERSHGGVQYGRSHAETEEMFQVRAMNAQLEALAGLSPNAPVKPTATNRGQPIGALPVPELPHEAPRAAFGDVVEEALRQFRALQSGLQDATKATGRLLSLPMEAARLAAQRLRLA